MRTTSLSIAMRASLFLLTVLLSLTGRAQSPESIANPNIGNPENYVADPFHQLNSNNVQEINKMLDGVREKTTCEVAVAVVKNLDGMTVEEYAYKLFRHWGLGKSDNNNGVLFVIATGDRKARIEVGSGAEGVLTDVACSKIIRRRLIPAMKDKNLNLGVYGVVRGITGALTDPAVGDELRSDKGGSPLSRVNIIDSNRIMSFILIVAGCVFLFTLVLFITDFVNTRRRDNYRRAMTWRNHLNTYWWGAALSFGSALPISLLAYALYRRARDITEICDTCGAKMKKLSEEEDNNYLTPSQDFEEQLKTVDYDVWLCPKCGTVERFPYVERQLKYQKCPMCNTIAMNLVMDKVVEPPTAKSEGHGVRVYKCQFCHHERRDDYVIPKKNDDAGLLAGAIIGGAVGSSLGRGGGGGGGFSGGFGGGHSSGGGASGGW